MNVIDTAVELQLLERCAIFKGINHADLARIREMAGKRRFPGGSFIFYQEEPADAFYLILAGRVRLTQVTVEGHQVIVHFFGPGSGLGIVAALGNIAYPLSAEVVEDCLVLVLGSDRIAELIESYPRLAINSLRLMAGRFSELQNRYRELATERVERRIARTLLRLAKQTGRKIGEEVLINMPLTRRDLAEMTGTTLYTVSRILSGWEQQGLVKTGREQVTLCSPHDIVIIAEDLPPHKASHSLT